jgi:hypothetical protein
MATNAQKYNKSVLNAVKASPAGMFPAAAAGAGISMGSKLGQAITKSPTGKLPAALKSYDSNLKNIAKAGMNVAGRAMGSTMGSKIKK